jgi:hypothetical protein
VVDADVGAELGASNEVLRRQVLDAFEITVGELKPTLEYLSLVNTPRRNKLERFDLCLFLKSRIEPAGVEHLELSNSKRAFRLSSCVVLSKN